MTLREIKDVSASVRQLLGNKARAANRQFDELLRYYAIERFLYRLSQSPYSTQFVLKGALMLVVWESPATRPTSDIDVLGQIENDPERLESAFREVCTQAVEPDGIVFDADSVRGEVITEQAAYPGVRLGITGRLGQARVVFHIDVGFGDAVFPSPETFTYPAILGMPAAVLLGYSRESAIAEKVETMIRFGPVNFRMKDFYDVWHLSMRTSFKGTVLSEAMARTFHVRATRIPNDMSGLLEAIGDETGKQAQWRAFLDRNAITGAPSEFPEVIRDIREFLAPLFRALQSQGTLEDTWLAGGPWEPLLG